MQIRGLIALILGRSQNQTAVAPSENRPARGSSPLVAPVAGERRPQPAPRPSEATGPGASQGEPPATAPRPLATGEAAERATGASEVETPAPLDAPAADARPADRAEDGSPGAAEVETPPPLDARAAPSEASPGASEVETPPPLEAAPPARAEARSPEADAGAASGAEPAGAGSAVEDEPPADPSEAALLDLARTRLAIEGVDPEIDGGRFAAKCVAGRPFRVEADAFSDGHEVIGVALRWRTEGASDWTKVEMAMIVNDRWGCEVTVPTPGYYEYTLVAWRDLFGTWHRDTAKKIAAGQDVPVEHEEGRLLVRAALEETPAEREALEALLRDAEASVEPLMAPEAVALMRRAEPRANLSHYPRVLPLFADREAAAFSAWYEMMPRSQGAPGEHGTFRDVIGKLDYVKGLGFDVLYFPPIHPIGTTNRKGKNNSLRAGPDDVGSPYAIGSPEGGFTAVHPELGTLEDFDALVSAARERGIELALDIALNASPDHPWIEEHPDWFERRPDGTIKYAENPPKKYEDIVNFRYYLPDGRPNAEFWEAIRDVILFWTRHGVLMFRVDNPHTKPFPFWEWIIREVRQEHPGAIFLSEAFTRPKVMKRLAKVGFSQSYSYFTWRNTKAELTEYLTELTTEECRHTMRPNFFVNTPDINPYFLQSSGRPGFRTRLILAGTLAGSYGVYNGYEICEAAAMPGKEEYLNSEKYELRHWDFDAPGNIQEDIRLLNRLRAERPALREFTNLRFYNAAHGQVLYYGKMDERSEDYLLFHVLLDPHAPAEFGFEVPLWEFGLPDEASIEVEDAIHGNRFTWHGKNHGLRLDPHERPYAIWRLLPPGGAR